MPYLLMSPYVLNQFKICYVPANQKYLLKKTWRYIFKYTLYILIIFNIYIYFFLYRKSDDVH